MDSNSIPTSHTISGFLINFTKAFRDRSPFQTSNCDLNSTVLSKLGFWTGWVDPGLAKTQYEGSNKEVLTSEKADSGQWTRAYYDIGIMAGMSLLVGPTSLLLPTARFVMSAVQDKELKNACSEGEWWTAGSKLVLHAPVVGPSKQSYDSYQNGNYKLAGFQALIACVESVPFITKAVEFTGLMGSPDVQNLPILSPQLNAHCLERCAERGIKKRDILAAVGKGSQFYDPKNESYVFIMSNLMSAVCPKTGEVKTAFRISNLSKRWIPMDRL